MKRYLRSPLALLLLAASSCLPLRASVNWLPYGPDGGDARAFAVDPHNHSHLYLGTAIGWIYESNDGGANWKRLAWIGKRDDLALDSIVVSAADSKRIVVGAWVLGSPDGGMFVSDDAGVSWRSVPDMKGESIRALSAAPSDPKVLVAGTLKGVYESADGGDHWKLISPQNSQELHEVESIAIDPVDPKIIYAGTWHLPWKTTDGGQHWANIKQGVIDDSDVFSIIVDPKDPKTVFASACSGIYKSDSAGDLFHKVQGIPSTARRTRVLMQDPTNRNVVFAGTTEGLYRTTDTGSAWQRMTGPEVIVNDVFVDPTNSNRVLLATDRGGVLASNDGGMSFSQSNAGFSARQVISYVADATTPNTIYVGVVNDKALGGVFVSANGGLSWSQRSVGLDGHDVFSLGQGPDGTIVAGTRHGIYRLQNEIWSRADNVTFTRTEVVKTHVPAKRATKTSPAEKAHVTETTKVVDIKPVGQFNAVVNSIVRNGDAVYAATSNGLVRSMDSGKSWHVVDGIEAQGWNYVAGSKQTMLVATSRAARMSVNGGQDWTTINLPDSLNQLSSIAVDGLGDLWVGGQEGVFISDDQGKTWHTITNLYLRDVSSIYADDPRQRVLISANRKNTIAFEVHLPDRKVRYWNTGWNLRLLRPVGDHLVGATLFDGIVIQPEMVDSREAVAAKQGATK